jgi:hypothetical protein
MAVMRAGLSGVALSPSGRLWVVGMPSSRHPLHAAREELLVELGPVDVPRELPRLPGVEALGRRGGREVERLVGPGVAELAEVVVVLLAEELAEVLHRVRVVVLVVLPVAEVEGALVVDLDEDDGAVGPAQARDLFADRAVPARRLLDERVAGVAGHGERDRHDGQDDRVPAGRARLALVVPDDALGEPEEGELGVDVRPRAEHALEAELVDDLAEARDVEGRIVVPEVELPGRRLVHAPGDVDVDDAEAHVLHGLEARAPVGRRVTPVVHRARPQRQDLAAAEVEAVRREADPRARGRRIGGT